jgi:hypothetical protein
VETIKPPVCFTTDLPKRPSVIPPGPPKSLSV